MADVLYVRDGSHEFGYMVVPRFRPASDAQIEERAAELGMDFPCCVRARDARLPSHTHRGVLSIPAREDRCSECGFYDGHWTACSRSTTASRHTDPCTTCDGTGSVGTFAHTDPATGEHRGDEPIPCPTCWTDGEEN